MEGAGGEDDEPLPPLPPSRPSAGSTSTGGDGYVRVGGVLFFASCTENEGERRKKVGRFTCLNRARQHAIHVWLDFSVPSLLARVKGAAHVPKRERNVVPEGN